MPALPAGGWDLDTLKSQVEGYLGKYAELKDVSVSAEPGVKYRELIKVIETLKKVAPKIYIAG